jgi:hypothetical protein
VNDQVSADLKSTPDTEMTSAFISAAAPVTGAVAEGAVLREALRTLPPRYQVHGVPDFPIVG